MLATTNKTLSVIWSHLAQSTNRLKSVGGKPWRPVYGLFAAGFVFILYGFDALETIFYDHARAPNVGLIAQLLLLLAVYMVWVVVPRGIWAVLSRAPFWSNKKVSTIRLVGFGAVAYCLHMIILAIVLRIMYSPPDWGAGDLFRSVTELMIQQAPLWWLAFVGAVGLIAYAINPDRMRSVKTPEPVYQVRHANKIVPVRVSDIHWVEAADNYVTLHTENAGYMFRKSISALEAETGGFGLVRSHRRALVNLSHVDAISRVSQNGLYHIELKNGGVVPLSRRRLSEVKNRLAGSPALER